MTTGRRERTLANRLVLAAGGAALVVVGIAVGVLVGRAPDGRAKSDRLTASMGPTNVVALLPGASASTGEFEAMRREIEGDQNAPTKRLLAFAHLALDRGDLPSAITAYKRVLVREPKNVEAITHVGLILYLGDHVDQALARLDEAIRIDPRYSHAQWDRAQILFHARQDYRGAIGALEAFLALSPSGDDADRAEAMLAEARQLSVTGAR